MSKSSSWKRKIDPAFDEFIRLALEILDAVKLPGNMGYIHVVGEDPHFEMIRSKRFPDFRSCYENVNPGNFVDRWMVSLGGIEGAEKPLSYMKELWQDFSTVMNGIALNKIDMVDDVLIKLVNGLEKESKDYYMTVFTFDSVAKLAFRRRSYKKQIERVRYQLSSVLSLFLHKAFIGSRSYRDVISDLTPELLKIILFEAWNVISVIVHGKTLRTLYVEAKNDGGDNKSLFKVMQIDKTSFDHDWVRERIRKAMYSGDRKFFRSLSKALYEDPLANRKIRLKEYLVLTFFWEVGLYRLTIPEMLDLFKYCGLAAKEDEVTFRKFIDRFKKVKPMPLPSLNELFVK